MEYVLRIPHALQPGAPLFVAVHGISRNADEHASLFAPHAEAGSVALLAPRFPADRFADYQCLGRPARGERADLALWDAVRGVDHAFELQTKRLLLFGFSGGAQFVHRFAMAYPERVAAVVVGAAGYYTFPDPAALYPLGLAGAQHALGLALEPARFLRVPMLVLVGARDVGRGPALNKRAAIDAAQGATRLDRAHHWVAAMRRAADEHGLPTPYELQVLPGVGHRFSKAMRRGSMGERAFDFFRRVGAIGVSA